MQERTHKDTTDVILFDADASSDVANDWFSFDYWRSRDALRVQSGGRGGVAVISTPAGECVLRHYRRGGMVATLMGDRYLWTGADRTRAFAEFRLLGEIARLGLPGPQVVAARYCRHGVYYTADLITRCIPDASTLAERLAAGQFDAKLAEDVGMLVARFHHAGIWHADLNAHNILVTPGQLYVIDFDRCELRQPAEAWRLSNLQRLRRSLVKLGAAAYGDAAFEQAVWQPLLHAYQRTFDA
ncbi:3-deoxy-D-manno-octulosonic acid kinase [Rhodanobacter sp. A1T4]|uniref:3-deoxy-D-manno-octulosonic acid kinase n=1 Tax=Rhodanobacter sp. A1T4 TaxID=2723087 RepID=UPI00160DFE1B|nr:3-deoxy-D-manno-octulosonic acid kinase [Rhodanobacter sp. A1T4]MBB6248689.1 3-deoxy-D-manno-octulosonic acid kinase [Rhodanobacter sp. A1T4]